MITIHDLFLTYAPFKRKQTASGWLSFCCPCCVDQGEARPDTKQRGGLKSEGDGSLIYHCFNCGFKTGYKPGEYMSNKMIYLLEKLGVPASDIEKVKHQIGKEVFEGKKAGKKASPSSKSIDFKQMDLPDGAKSISYWANLPNVPTEFLNCMEYLYSRGTAIFNGYEYYWTPQRTIKKGNISYTEMNKRIIIPYYHKGEIVGWSARYASSNVPKGALRYLKDVQPDYIFNSKVFSLYDRKYIILVEGEFDAISIDAVSPLGRKLSKAQANWLKQTGKEIIIVGDRENSEDNLVKFALEYDFSASFPLWDATVKDVADAVKKYGKIYTLQTILNSRVQDKFGIMMGLKRKIRVF